MNPEELIAFQGLFARSNLTIRDIANEQRAIVVEIENIDRMRAASTFAALLASPLLQANAYRLEALVHIVAARSAGNQALSPNFLQRAFEAFGAGVCGRMEDPAEDLFSSTVHCRSGNFTVFEGLREANGFYLQRVLDVIDEMPDKEPFNGIRRSVVALLTISDATARRARVVPRIVGTVSPLASLPEGIFAQLGNMHSWVLFSDYDPELQFINRQYLEPFLYTAANHDLLAQSLGHTSLERHPLLRFGDLLCLALPTAVGSSITRFVLGKIKSLGKMSAFESALARIYWELLSSTSLIPRLDKLLPGLKAGPTMRIPSVIHEVDRGRYLHLAFLEDPIEDLDISGFLEVSPACVEQSELVMEQVFKAKEMVQDRSGFRDGITLAIGCGLGRASIFAAEAAPENWRVAYLPVHDALTMAWMEEFSPLDIWRVLDSDAAVHSAGISLLNLNGLLNLIAWAKTLKGHLVPHGEIPTEFRGADSKRLVVVDQNAVLGLRESVQCSHHTLAALDENRVFRRVRRIGGSAFSDDRAAPLYVDEEALKDGRLKAVYIAGERFWWIEIQARRDVRRHDIYEHWRMLYVWLQRIAPVLQERLAEALPPVVCFSIHFERIVGVRRGSAVVPGKEALHAAFQRSVDQSSGVIWIRIGDTFDDALASPDNIAEQALVDSMIGGALELAGADMDSSERARLLEIVCPSPHARSRHMMPAQDFRDMIRAGSGHPLSIDLMDDALSRLGLAFRVRADVSDEITGIEHCTSFLNQASHHVLDELCSSLRSFNRERFIEVVLENHESAAIHREVWRRTAHANLALHGEGALDVVAQHIAEMNACSIASRILIEAAVCECPAEGGSVPGQLDLSRAMAKALYAFHVGGWSDAVHWGAIAPLVRITPLGDIHIDHTFIDTIYSPFTQSGGHREVRREVEAYAKAYSEPPMPRSGSDLIESSFLHAWEREYGVPLDVLRRFVDDLENMGVDLDKLWFKCRRSELTTKLAEVGNRNPEDAETAIDLLTLPSRSHWKEIPAGFREKDWYPWRFRRRLSLVRRPLIQLEESLDPTILVAPAIVREALYILLRSFHSGETPDWQVSSIEMRRWLGHTNRVERTAFNGLVASTLRDLGWSCEPDYKVTRLFGFSLERDYGDIDALAWDPNSGRVLAIECKDLHFHKTFGEVAEQLSDFRGVVRPDGERDLLRKHLDRLAIMEQNRAHIQARLKLQAAPDIQGYIVFRHPVPMQFAWEQLKEKIRLLLFDELGSLRI